MIRAGYRFVDYKVREDATAERTREAVCVVGEDSDCGISSGELVDEEKVTRWMAEHRRDTGHSRFKRLFTDYATVEPQK
ncbi:hypothetical protein [Streptomyces sp. NPDC005407]|uniref:DUF7848 domain-containing protein n=1 Tax=Streptomyces sp. NPDC005407 TaxID=3155340 RepID=UPI0033B852C7